MMIRIPYKLDFRYYADIRKKKARKPDSVAIGADTYTFVAEVKENWNKQFAVKENSYFDVIIQKRLNGEKTVVTEYIQPEKDTPIILSTEYESEKEADEFISFVTKHFGIYSLHQLPGGSNAHSRRETLELITETLIAENDKIMYLHFDELIEIPEQNKRITMKVVENGYYYFSAYAKVLHVKDEKDRKRIQDEMKKQQHFYDEVVKIMEKNRVKLLFAKG